MHLYKITRGEDIVIVALVLECWEQNGVSTGACSKMQLGGGSEGPVGWLKMLCRSSRKG